MSAVLILPSDADRDDWLKARQAGIGASEIAAVMGISPYDSPFSLWWRKHMGWSNEASTEMRTGTFLEDAVAGGFLEFFDPNENLMLGFGGLYRSGEREWQLATPDRLIHLVCDECDGRGGSGTAPCDDCGGYRFKADDFVAPLECKWVAYSWDGWGTEADPSVPVHYRAQALQQLDVMETETTEMCALGPGGFQHRMVRRDEKDLVMMREAGRRFMDSLAEGTPPDVDSHSATLPMVRRLHSLIEDGEQEIPETIATGWLRSKRFKALADRVEKRYSAQLRAHLGTAKTAMCNGVKIAARSSDDKLMRKS